MILALLYTLLFLLLIFKSRWFRLDGIKPLYVSSAFLIKVISGLLMTYIYSVYYTDRSTADIFKYYDDAKIMFNALYENPLDYLKMVSGIANDSPHFDEMYYSKMNHWFRRYDFGTYNDNHTVIRFNALVMLFSFGNYEVHPVFMCMLSFFGLIAMYRFIIHFFYDKKYLVFISVFLIPSVVFWGSGVLKEGIVIFSLGLLLNGFLKLFVLKEIRFVHGFSIVISILLLLINKNYILILLLPVLICFWFCEAYTIKRKLLFYIIFHSTLFTIGYYGSKYIMEVNVLEKFSHKQRDFINLSKGGLFIINSEKLVRLNPADSLSLKKTKGNKLLIKQGSSYMYWINGNFSDTLFEKNARDSAEYALLWNLPIAGSIINLPLLKSNVWSFVSNAPRALFNCLYKPAIWEKGKLPEKAAGAENLVLFLLLLFSLLTINVQKIHWNFLYFCLSFTILLFVLIGYTTPVAGALVRYKIPAMPFLFMVFFNLMDLQKLRGLLKR